MFSLTGHCCLPDGERPCALALRPPAPAGGFLLPMKHRRDTDGNPLRPSRDRGALAPAMARGRPHIKSTWTPPTPTSCSTTWSSSHTPLLRASTSVTSSSTQGPMLTDVTSACAAKRCFSRSDSTPSGSTPRTSLSEPANTRWSSPRGRQPTSAASYCSVAWRGTGRG